MNKKMTENTYSSDRHHPTSPAGKTTSDTNVILVPQLETVYSRAAKIIQRAWRAHVDTAVFKHLKKLVSFHNQGDPRLLLRFINPAEADILDAASGALVRFRLGGPTYPPNIYFKIYTRAPIVDMCASSPKDYTQKKPAPSQIHNGRLMINDREDHSGWYQRAENNGWRILSCKISVYEDPITQDTNVKKIQFHHCKIRRRQDVARKKKIRKIEWMRKMYAEGLLHAHTEHSETALLVQKSTESMMDSLEQIEPDLVSEQEVDELLAWTKALNFDEYINEWRKLGTSKCCIVKDRLSEGNQKDFACVSVRDISEVPQIIQDPVVSQHLDHI
ncbi:protein MFI [Garra rufa]|uniref:protein MFI n=1 Tax=Garra rufa TaxID=137080 RepID=UPI003CCEAB69